MSGRTPGPVERVQDLPRIDGVELRSLETRADARGHVAELWRSSTTPLPPRQWTLTHTGAGALRGLHVHREGTDHLVVVGGRLLLALVDLRPDSPTADAGGLAWWGAPDSIEVTIPPGVLHGWWSDEGATALNWIDREWAGDDDDGVRFDDDDLGLRWPPACTSGPLLSARDEAWPPLAALDRSIYAGRASSAARTSARA